MPVHILPPSAALADRVLFYVAREGDDDLHDVVQRFPANLYAALTITHRGTLLDAEALHPMPMSTLSGLMTRAVQRRYAESPITTVAVLRPGALTDLLRLPASELTDTWVDTNALLPPALHDEMHERMASAGGVARRIHALEDVLQRRFAGARGPARKMSAALQSLVWHLPHLTVSDLADRFGCSARTLQRRFDDVFGASPRMVMRLARLQLTLAHMQRRRHRLADIAHMAGFADAAHLAREVRTLAGAVPSALQRLLDEPDPSAWAFAAPQDALLPRS